MMSRDANVGDDAQADAAVAASWLAGGGAAGAAMRAIDWSATPLGPTRHWPQSLRTSLSICLSSPVPIALYWGAELVMLHNDALSAILGADPPRALGRPIAEAPPALRDLVEPLLQRVVRTGDAASSDDVALPGLPGELLDERHVALSCSAIRDESGRIAGVFCAVLETTQGFARQRRERALAEEQRARAEAEAARARIYSLFMQAPAPICILEGRDHRYTFANQPYLTLIGRDDIVGQTLAEAYPERVARTGKILDQAYATGQTVRGIEVPFRFAPPGGALIDGWFNVVYEPFRDLDGEVCGILVVAFDVTDAVLAREANEHARREAEAAAAAQRAILDFQERFVAVLGHDLRNPLAAIDMAASVVGQQAEKSRDAITHRAATRIKSSSLRMSRMVEQILDLSRSRIGGGLVVRPSAMDLCAMLSAVVEELRTANPSHQIQLRCTATPGTWDRDRLEQVFSNLIGNAIHHGLAEAPITVDAHDVGDEVHIEVHNEGPPIPEALRSVLFNPFRRGDRDSRTRKTAGLGLGLYISRELALAHGGNITVSSSADGGTTFRVTLPRGAKTLTPA